MPHIERRRNLWYAVLMVPKDCRAGIGIAKFVRSLRTPDKRRAQLLAAPVVAGWQAQIRRERGEGNALNTEALRWRLALNEARDNDAGDIEIGEKIVELAERIERTDGLADAERFATIATSSAELSDANYDAWAAQIGLTPKTMDQMKKDVRVLLNQFPLLNQITHQAVKGWLDELKATGVSPSSRKRIVSFCRNYWAYLKTINAVSSDSQPFAGLVGGKARKRGASNGSWVPFSVKEVIAVWKEARKIGDEPLADLIMLGAYTGARIEELCSLKLEEVAKASFKITDAKTEAGIREVPIHSEIRNLVQRLRQGSKDDYLMSGLTFNKYRDRSNAIGKRFGRLKTSMGFGEKHVFHSIRKTLVTLLENAGVSENLAADIVGHDKPRITFGLYSGGASLSVKAKAIEKARYPFGTAA